MLSKTKPITYAQIVHKQLKGPLFVLALLYSLTVFSQTPRIRLTLHARVDTSQADIKAIVRLWEQYLNSRPDSIYDNPCWNAEEKQTYRDFDFTRAALYQFPSAQLLQY